MRSVYFKTILTNRILNYLLSHKSLPGTLHWPRTASFDPGSLYGIFVGRVVHLKQQTFITFHEQRLIKKNIFLKVLETNYY